MDMQRIYGQAAYQQNDEAFNVVYFFVAINEQRDGYKLLCAPVSPNFRTRDEAEAYRDRCGKKGAFCVNACFFADNADEALSLEAELFAQKSPAT